MNAANADSSGESPLDKAERERREAETSKLRAETAELTRAWYKRPKLILIISPSIFALIMFLWAWVSGYFNDRRTELSQELRVLTEQIATAKEEHGHDAIRFELEKKNFNDAVSNMKMETERLLSERDELKVANELSERARIVIEKVAEIEGIVGIFENEEDIAYFVEFANKPLFGSGDYVSLVHEVRPQGGLSYRGPRHNVDSLFKRLPDLPNVRGVYIETDKYQLSSVGIQQLQKLENLERLELTGEGITDSLMSYLGVLKQLESLELYATRISEDGLGSALNACPNLERLVIWDLGNTPNALDLVGKHNSLRSIAVSTNDKVDIRSLLQLNDLRSLELNCAELEDFGSVDLTGFEDLELLSIAINSDKEAVKVSDIQSLRKLFCTSNAMSTRGLNSLSRLSDLTELSIDCNYAQDQSFSFLRQFKHLEKLRLHHAHIGKDGFDAIAQLVGLRELHLHGAHFDDEDLARLANLRQLESLDLSQLHLAPFAGVSSAEVVLTEEGVKHLRQLSELRSLELNGCKLPSGIVAVLEGLKKLKWVALSETGLTVVEWERLRKALPGAVFRF